MGAFLAPLLLGAGASAAAVAAVGFAINLGISYLLVKNAGGSGNVPQPQAVPDPGVKQRLPADTSNRLPVVYGEERLKGMIFMGDITSDNQKMAVLIALCEGPIQSIGKVIWDNYELTFDGSGNVTNAVSVETGESDDFLNGKLRIVKYPEGGRCPEMEAFSSKWNLNSNNRQMPNMAYVYLEVTYDRDNNITGLPGNITFDCQGRTVRTINSDGTFSTTETYSTNPAECLLDYLTNTRYGTGNIIKSNLIDGLSFYNHKQFCDELLPYMDSSGVQQMAKRYTTNGFVNTNDSRDTIVSDFIQSSSGILSYSVGRFTLTSDTVGTSVKSFTDDNIYGDVVVSEEGFNTKLNSLTISFDDVRRNFQQDQVYLETPANLKNENEPELSQDIVSKFSNNLIEATRLGTIIINKSRLSQTISFATDLSALALQPGDIITVTREALGIENKLFRIDAVTEESLDEGVNGFKIAASEYSAETYTDLVINENDTAPNATFPNPRLISKVLNVSIDAQTGSTAPVPFINISWTIPGGPLADFDIYYSSTSNDPMTAQLLKVVGSSDSSYTAGETFATTITELEAGTYWFWVRGKNSVAKGPFSDNSTLATTWNPNVAVVGATLNPEWDKTAIIVSDVEGVPDLSQANAKFYLLVGGGRATLSPELTPAADLPVGNWSIQGASFSPTGGATGTTTDNLVDNEVDVVFDTLTVNTGVITLNFIYKDEDGNVANLTSALAIAVAPAGSPGLDGYNTADVRLYQASFDNTTAPDLFSGTFTYNFANGTLTGGVLNGWSTVIPSLDAGQYLWQSDYLAVSRETTLDIPASSFSTPVIGASSGTPGEPGNEARTIYLYQSGPVDTPPAPPVAPNGLNTMTGQAEQTGGWLVNPPTPTPDMRLYGVQLNITKPGDSDTWEVTEGSAWVRFQLSGSPGGTGAAGPKFATVTLYTNPAVADTPLIPSATITWATGNLTGISPGWATSPPTQLAVSNDRVWSSIVLFSDPTGEALSTIAQGSTPVPALNFDGIVTFSDGNFILDGSTITTIDGGNIATGTITANQLAAGLILTRTLRSDNYIPPEFYEFPPTQGYSLEHIAGIGYFEELRGNVVGNIRAPAEAPILRDATFTTNLVTKEYMTTSVGEVYSPVFTNEIDGETWYTKGKLSPPVLTLPVTSFQERAQPTDFFINYTYFVELRAASNGFSIYATVTELPPDASLVDLTVGLIAVGYKSDGTMVPIGLDEGTNGLPNFSTILSELARISAVSPEVGMTYTADTNLPAYVAVNVDSEGQALELDNIKLHFWIDSGNLSVTSRDATPVTDMISPALNIGVEAASAVEMTIDTVDDSAPIIPVTQE